MFCDVTQHFVYRFDDKSMQIHRNLIAFLVLRCFDRFWRPIDAIHCNLITLVSLRCFELFATKVNIFYRFDFKSMQIHRNLITFVVLSCSQCFAT